MARRGVQTRPISEQRRNPLQLGDSLIQLHASGHRTLVHSHPKKGRGLVAMETPRMSGRWDMGGLHHLEDLRGVTAEGLQAWQLLMSLQP